MNNIEYTDKEYNNNNNSKLYNIKSDDNENKDDLKYFTTLYKLPKYLEKVNNYFLSYNFFSVFSIQY